MPQTIAAGATYSCSFTGAVSGNAGSSHTDVVTASGKDDDGNNVSDDDDATVRITDTRQLDPRHEDGRSDDSSGAGRERVLLGHRQEHVGGRLGHDLEPLTTTSTATSTARAPATCR